MPISKLRINSNSKLVHGELSYILYGILFAVHNELGRYCNEMQYADTIEKYLKSYKMSCEREKVLPPSFEGEAEGRNKVDFLIEGKVVLEAKAKRILERVDYYQVKRYLVALNRKLGIIVNLRDKFLRPRRILNSLAKA